MYFSGTQCRTAQPPSLIRLDQAHACPCMRIVFPRARGYRTPRGYTQHFIWGTCVSPHASTRSVRTCQVPSGIPASERAALTAGLITSHATARPPDLPQALPAGRSKCRRTTIKLFVSICPLRTRVMRCILAGSVAEEIAEGVRHDDHSAYSKAGRVW
jgi:hypothetical protein